MPFAVRKEEQLRIEDPRSLGPHARVWLSVARVATLTLGALHAEGFEVLDLHGGLRWVGS